MMALRNYDAWRTREPEPYNGIGNWRLGVTVTVDVLDDLEEAGLW